MLMDIHHEPTHQLVVACLWVLIHGSRIFVDVYTEELVLLAGLSAIEHGLCVRHGSGDAGVSREHCMDPMGGHSAHHGGMLVRGELI